MRLSGWAFVVLLALVGILAVAATDQIVPATSQHQAEMRIWLAARAAGVTAYLLLTLQVTMGLVLSHPTAQERLKQGKRVFPWHENAWIFVLGFLGAHIAAVIADPWAGVGIGGAFIPGLSEYRSSAVALGTMSLYALLLTGLTARYTRRLPAGLWLRIHRVALVVLVMAWLHGVLAGTDSQALLPMYLVTGAAVAVVAAWRYWVVRPPRVVVAPDPAVAEGPSAGTGHVPAERAHATAQRGRAPGSPARPAALQGGFRPLDRSTEPIAVEVTIR